MWVLLDDLNPISNLLTYTNDPGCTRLGRKERSKECMLRGVLEIGRKTSWDTDGTGPDNSRKERERTKGRSN